MKLLFRTVILGIIIAVLVVLSAIPKPQPKAVRTNPRDEEAKNWMQTNIVDRDAELLGFSETRKLWDGNFQVGWIRGQNPSGVTAVTHYVFEVGPEDELLRGWPSRDFLALKKLELNEMDSSIQGRRALELQRFCKEMGIPIEKEL
ncbi:MAG: hypothetical protein ACAH88_10635 [Roseimicrobium sp.]